MVGTSGESLSTAPGRRADADANGETRLTLSSTQRVYLQLRYGIGRVLAAALLALASPLFLAIAIAVALDSPGGVFFRHQRIGRGGAHFAIYKFRSLAKETPKYCHKLSLQDPRITRVGRVIRLACLDELPQLLNVVRGEMAIIGPRPEMPFVVDLLDPMERQREMLKPGITGWWQVHHRDNVALKHNIQRDLFYIEHLGPLIDLQILLMTIRVVITGAVSAVRVHPV